MTRLYSLLPPFAGVRSEGERPEWPTVYFRLFCGRLRSKNVFEPLAERGGIEGGIPV